MLEKDVIHVVKAVGIAGGGAHLDLAANALRAGDFADHQMSAQHGVFLAFDEMGAFYSAFRKAHSASWSDRYLPNGLSSQAAGSAVALKPRVNI